MVVVIDKPHATTDAWLVSGPTISNVSVVVTPQTLALSHGRLGCIDFLAASTLASVQVYTGLTHGSPRLFSVCMPGARLHIVRAESACWIEFMLLTTPPSPLWAQPSTANVITVALDSPSTRRLLFASIIPMLQRANITVKVSLVQCESSVGHI